MNVPAAFYPNRGSESLALVSASTLIHEPVSPRSPVPRSRRFGKQPTNGLTKEMIHRAFLKSPSKHAPIGVASDDENNDFNASIRSIASKTVSVECGFGNSPKRHTSSPRVTARGRLGNTTGSRKPTYPKSSRLRNTGLQASIPRLDTDIARPENTKSAQVTLTSGMVDHATLNSIAVHKSCLAELRPSNRRVKFSHRLHDTDEKGNTLTRIQALTLQDLSNHGYGNVVAPDSVGKNATELATSETVAANLSRATGPQLDKREAIRKLETSIRHAIRALERLDDGIEKERNAADAIESENQGLRRELVSCALLSRGSVTLNSTKHLSTLVDELETQLKGLDIELQAG